MKFCETTCHPWLPLLLPSRDACLGTPPGAVVDAAGCSGAQRVALTCPATGTYENHGDYVSCVSRAVAEQRSAGRLTADEASALVSAAARGNVGK